MIQQNSNSNSTFQQLAILKIKLVVTQNQIQYLFQHNTDFFREERIIIQNYLQTKIIKSEPTWLSKQIITICQNRKIAQPSKICFKSYQVRFTLLNQYYRMHKQTPLQRRQRIAHPRKILDQIVDLQTDPHQIPIPSQQISLYVHFIFKVIPLFLVAFDQLTAKFFEEQYTGQMIIIMIVLEFWITKNYTGKKMLGYKWFFGQDEYGYERLMFECRANKELVDPGLPRLFYIIQIVYIVVAWLLLFEAVFIIPNIMTIEHRKIRLNFLLMVSGVANLFCFYIVSDSVADRQDTLRRELGIEQLRKLEYGSIVSHY